MAGEIRFDGQVAIVTGAGRGIGRSYAIELAARGASVVVNDVDAAVSEAVVAEIEKAGGSAVACTESSGTHEGAGAVVSAAVDAFSSLDVLVNNAGVFRMGHLEDLGPEGVVQMINVHLLGYLWLTQHAWPVFRGKGYGRVVMTSSAAIFGHAGSASYAAAKGGVIGLTHALAHESEQHGIKVNAILPSARTQDYRLESVSPGVAEGLDELGRRLHGRVQPELNAPLTTYLASRECAFNGEAFHAGGGVYKRVFLGITEGWVAEDLSALAAEAIAEHMDEIAEVAGFQIGTATRDPLDRAAAQLDDLLGPPVPAA